MEPSTTKASTEVERLADGTPARLGRYRLVRPISTGGMARVFEARRDGLAGVSPRVAIKVILPEHARHEGFQRLFINEARVGSLLGHQNLVQIQDFDHQEDRFYLVMEFVEGVTLRRAISLCRRHGLPVPLEVVAEIGRQVCDGLNYAHLATAEDGSHLRLVHRDIKPSNLILNPQGVVKLLDFGISKALLTAERPGAVRGTWGYMAPEQAGGHEVGPQTDMFGLAAVLYELAALQPLFPEKEPDDLRRLLAADEAARRASALTGPFAPLGNVLVRALQRDPAARFSSASAMGRALSGLVTDPVTARDRLVRFQKDLVARAAHGVVDPRRGGRTASTMSPTGASQVSMGLPLAVGDAQGPRPVVDRRKARPQPTGPTLGARLLRAIPVVLLVAGAAVVGFTGLTLLAERQDRQVQAPPADADPLRRLVEGDAGDQVATEAPGAPQPTREGSVTGGTITIDPGAIDPGAIDPGGAAAGGRAAAGGSTGGTTVVAPTAGASAAGTAPAATASTQSETVRPASGTTSLDRTAEPAAGSTDAASTGKTTAVGAGSGTASRGTASSGTAGSAASGTVAVGEQAPGSDAAFQAPPPVATIPVTVSSQPRAIVAVDGERHGHTPKVGLELSPGKHSITLTADDGRRTTFTIDVVEGRSNRWIWDFESRSFK